MLGITILIADFQFFMLDMGYEMITIVNYGLGNLGSIQNMLKRIGVESVIASNYDEVKKAEKIILPGVGKFDAGMKGIEKADIKEILDYKALSEKVPVLGICLGMQLLTGKSQEGTLPGLGWIDAEVLRFNLNSNFKVPHMGWNETELVGESALTENLNGARFYFVHSYYVKMCNENETILKTEYGVNFTSAFQHENIYGVQFHPEKSHKYGMQLLKNFSEL